MLSQLVGPGEVGAYLHILRLRRGRHIDKALT